MQNWIFYHLLSGNLWFVCGGIFLAAAGLDAAGVFDKYRRLGRVAHFLLVLAMPLAALTGTPLPWWFALPLVAACLVYVAFGFTHKKRRVRLLSAGGAAILVLAGLLLELPYHLTRPPATARPGRVFILADSLTAGMGERATWPKLLRRRTSLEIRDLSQAGATTGSALARQVPLVEAEADPDAWVFVEIGGNDMLGDTSAEQFARELDELLARVRGDPERPRQVLMMELPIFIGKWGYAAAQRNLAARPGVVLVPKRVLATVLFAAGNTTDDIHLSPAGHACMAELLLPWLGGGQPGDAATATVPPARRGRAAAIPR
jgi:acyl-CoA thioesterase-1